MMLKSYSSGNLLLTETDFPSATFRVPPSISESVVFRDAVIYAWNTIHHVHASFIMCDALETVAAEHGDDELFEFARLAATFADFVHVGSEELH